MCSCGWVRGGWRTAGIALEIPLKYCSINRWLFQTLSVKCMVSDPLNLSNFIHNTHHHSKAASIKIHNTDDLWPVPSYPYSYNVSC
jgi:hypothetical protein